VHGSHCSYYLPCLRIDPLSTSYYSLFLAGDEALAAVIHYFDDFFGFIGSIMQTYQSILTILIQNYRFLAEEVEID